ncbi:hypothetical protein HW49_03030 [Porphyromonadaceae bacterium COT-184 OH4590]|nr:hypothetical protein HW49_03030 [Porphyromonadaceae bacterium COT-184 OH4590]
MKKLNKYIFWIIVVIISVSCKRELYYRYFKIKNGTDKEVLMKFYYRNPEYASYPSFTLRPGESSPSFRALIDPKIIDNFFIDDTKYIDVYLDNVFVKRYHTQDTTANFMDKKNPYYYQYYIPTKMNDSTIYIYTILERDFE